MIASGSDPQGSAGLCAQRPPALRGSWPPWPGFSSPRDEGQRADGKKSRQQPGSAPGHSVLLWSSVRIDAWTLHPKLPTCRGWSLGLRFPKGFRQASSGSAVGSPAKPAGAAAETEEEASGRACFPGYS